MTTGQNTAEVFNYASGVYTPADNNTRADLFRTNTGTPTETFTLRASNGTVTTFYGFYTSIGPQGCLNTITDRFGNTQTFAWQTLGGLNRLATVTDSFGRAVNYSYYGSENGYLLSQITDFLGRQLNFQYDNLGHLVAIVTPSIMKGATGNTFPGGTAYVFQWDVDNPRVARQNDLIKIWFPNEATPFIDVATRMVDVAAVYASATPRYIVQYNQDPTDTDMYGRVAFETIGDPVNGIGGTYSYLFSTHDLPSNLIDPSVDGGGDPIIFQCTVTDPNQNQVVYGFNAAQMPSMVQVMRTRNKIDIPSPPPTSYTTWTKFNLNNQPLLTIFPEGNSVAMVYDTNPSGLSSVYNRRLGLLLSRTESPTNRFAGTTIPANRPDASNGQDELTETFFYEPIFNQLCATIERRGNPIGVSGGSNVYFVPQNGGTTPTDSNRSRYATTNLFDYQKDTTSTLEMDSNLVTNILGLTSSGDIATLIAYASTQMTSGGLPAGFQMGMGDINGDGTGEGTEQNANHLGSVVKIVRPTVNLITPLPGSESTTEPRLELFTSNLRGQTTTHTDPNGNLEVIVRYPFNDPEGDGGMSANVPTLLGGKQYGRIKEIHVDADPDDVLSLVGGDGDLVDFLPSGAIIPRTNSSSPLVYQDLVTRYEGGSGAGGSGCSSCAYDPMGNPLALTSARGFTARFDRNELGEAYRTISPQPYGFLVENYFDANRNVVRVDTEDQQPAFDSCDPTSAAYAQFTPTGSNNTAHVRMRPGWFTDLFTFNLLNDLIQQDIDATGSTPANLVTKFGYDPNRSLIVITKPEGNLVEFDYEERNLRIAVRVGRDMSLSPPEPGSVTVIAYDLNGNVLEVIGPVVRSGGTTDTATIEDAFRSGATVSYTGDKLLLNEFDGFDRVIQATDALGNYVDTGAGYGSDPFLDPDGRVIRVDRYGIVGPYDTSIVMLASARMRFDEAGRQYELEREVFVAANTVLPSHVPLGRTVTHVFTGCLQANNATPRSTGSAEIFPPGPSTYVLTRTVFDPGDRPVQVLADNTGATTITYDGADRQINVLDAMGNSVKNTFDADDNLVASTRSEICTISGVTTIETFSSAMFYDCLNQLVLAANQGADGNLSADVMGLAAAGVSFWELSSWNLSTSTLISCMAFDSRGNGVLSVDPKGNSSVMVLDGASRTIQTQQHLRQEGQGGNPPAANQTLLPGGGAVIVTTVILDGNGRPTQLIDDRGDITLAQYDTLDREVAMIFHDGSVCTSQYNEAGDVILFTDGNGSQFENTFDSLGRKISVDITLGPGIYLSSTTASQIFDYDGLSRVVYAQNEGTGGMDASEVVLVYDSIGRVLEDAQTFGNARYVTNTGFFSYPVNQFTFPSGRQLASTYDLLYRRDLLQDETGSYQIASWQFFGPSRVARVQLGNTLTCTWMNNALLNSAVQSGVANPPWVAPPAGQSADRLGYDGAGRMITKRYVNTSSGTPTSALVGFTTAFDRASNKFYERALHAEPRSSLYEPFDPTTNLPEGGYDSLDRLLQYQRGVLNSTGGDGGNGGGSVGTTIAVANTDTQRSYQLDGLGNWRNTTFTPVGGSSQTEVRQHNGLNQITRRKNPTAGELVNPTYDLNGNLTNDGSRLFFWDALNRLCEVNKITGTDPLSSTEIAKYFYDAFNRRIQKVVYGGGYRGGVPAGTTDFIYSGWRCVEDRNPSGDTDTLLVQYVWGRYLDELLQMRTYLGSTGPEGLPPGVYYPLQDLLYRTTALTNSSGAIVEAYDTDAYGNTLIFSTPGGGGNWWSTGTAQAAYPACPYIFTGQRFDAETGLYYYKNRYYWPDWGRFLSEDPIAADLSLYRYVKNRPLTDADTTGLGYFDTWIGVNPNGKCCKKPIKMWQYWQYRSPQECVSHIIVQTALRPGGFIFGLGSSGFALLKPTLQNYIKLGNWSQVAATLAASWAATFAARLHCDQDFCLNSNIVPPKCTIYEYPALGVSWLWTCTRLECHCPTGSIDWTDIPIRLGTP
jgi:RHS repeat-associated protein